MKILKRKSWIRVLTRGWGEQKAGGKLGRHNGLVTGGGSDIETGLRRWVKGAVITKASCLSMINMRERLLHILH